MKSNKKISELLCLDYVAVAIIVIAFFVISYSGFYFSDDLSMAYGGAPIRFGERIREIVSIFDVFKLTWWWYFHLGGRHFSVAAQYFFCGLLDNKVWFDIVNTLFFLLLMIVCGKLICSNDSKHGVRYVLIFALSFWFLCPKPSQTLFWVAGSTTHLWGNALAFVFLWFFQKYKDDSFTIIGKLGLFFMSIVAVAEFIPCVSICGAFVIFYVFHIKKLKGNVVPFVVGYIVGSMLLLFAPGNFRRAELLGEIFFIDNLRCLLNHLILEVVKYRALWMFLTILVWGCIKNKEAVKPWIRSNSVLLLSLGWSVIAFSIVFRPENRALFFPETMSLVLFLKFLFDNYKMFGVRFLYNSKCVRIIQNAVIMLLFVVFVVDSAFAVTETKKQSENNDILLNEIKDSGWVIISHGIFSSHRMSYTPFFPEWTREPLANRFGLDFEHVYPFYCLEKFYKEVPPFENIVVLGFEKGACLIVRIEKMDLEESNNHVIFTIDYTRPRKRYKSWLYRVFNYNYNRTIVFEKYMPDACFDGYCYYVLWFNQENDLKSVKYTIE